jgi:hypothetical protein
MNIRKSLDDTLWLEVTQDVRIPFTSHILDGEILNATLYMNGEVSCSLWDSAYDEFKILMGVK